MNYGAEPVSKPKNDPVGTVRHATGIGPFVKTRENKWRVVGVEWWHGHCTDKDMARLGAKAVGAVAGSPADVPDEEAPGGPLVVDISDPEPSRDREYVSGYNGGYRWAFRNGEWTWRRLDSSGSRVGVGASWSAIRLTYPHNFPLTEVFEEPWHAE